VEKGEDVKIKLVMTGRSYHTANELPDELELAEGSSLDDVLELLAANWDAKLALPASCLVAVSGRHLGTVAQHTPAPLREGDEILLIAPVAGG
jgi:molybdopterin converting factor small subunit